MTDLRPYFRPEPGKRPRTAIFLSGGGSNAEQLLARWDRAGRARFEVCCLVTDRPAKSRAREIAAHFGLPVVAHDIAAFYRRRGLPRVSLATPAGQQAREAWTDELRAALAPYRLDFGLFAGFIPLSNLTGDFPCLNVHPGDLTHLASGRRLLVGLHTIPIELALLAGLDYLRSSVLIAEPFTGRGENMDCGALLAVSAPVPVDWQGHTVAELRALAAARPAVRPSGGFDDALARLAAANQDRLTEHGDWVVFPQVTEDFAAGRFQHDEQGRVYYCDDVGAWVPVRAVVYGPAAREVLRQG